MKKNIIPQIMRKNFSLDLRSLSLFRVATAFLLIIDFLCTRLPWFSFFYTEKGLLPLGVALENNPIGRSSLNFISINDGYQATLFFLAIVFFFMLLVGYKTKWALLGSWLMLVSFRSRNFLILNSGDILLCLMLFWALYLPLNRYFSLDKGLYKSQNEKDKSIFSLNSCAFIFQILFVYYFTYLLKSDDIWKNGQGIYYALMLDNYGTMWGDILLRYPYMMKLLSYTVYYFLEGIAPILFILFGFWWRLRIVIILLMCGFHIFSGFFLHLGLFPWICITGWLVFLPAQFWDLLEAVIKSLWKLKTFSFIGNWFHGKVADSRNILRKLSPTLKEWPMPPNNFLSVLLNVFFLLCFMYVIMWNVRTLDFTYYKKYMPKSWNSIGYFFHLDQYWSMFAPRPMVDTGWLMLAAVEKDTGRKIDLWRGGAFICQSCSDMEKDSQDYKQCMNVCDEQMMKKPYRYDESFPVFRYRKLMENLVHGGHQKHSFRYLQYMCDQWNRDAKKELVKNIQFFYMQYRVPPPEKKAPKPEKLLISEVSCLYVLNRP